MNEDEWLEWANEQAKAWACKYCNTTGEITIQMGIEVKAPGTHSLSGSTMKASGFFKPLATCGTCGHVSWGSYG